MDCDKSKSISYENFPFICRICLSNKSGLKPFVQSNLLNLFTSITNIVIEPSSNLPENVCDGCLKNLDDISCFISQSKDNDANLRKILKEWKTKLYYDDDSSDSAGADDSTEPYVKPEADDSKNDSDDCEGSTKSDKEACTPAEFVKLETSESNHKGGEKKKVNRKRTPKKRVSKRQPSNCEICGESFRTKGLLAEHQKQNVVCRTKPFKCARCDMAFNRKFRLNLHMRSHTKETPFECKICSRKFTLCSNLKRHEDIVHKGLRPFKCDICGKEFPRLERKIHHMNIHNGRCSLVCGYCGKDFRHRSTYRSHITQHKIENGEMQDLLEHQCQFCKKIFSSKHILESHKEIHIKQQKYLCFVCGKDFAKKNYLAVHCRIHTGEKPYECKECGKQFKYASGYKAHILFHTGERSFKCNICSKAFKQSAHLRTHSKIHTGEKPFKCHVCGKDFAHKCNLDGHIRRHIGAKPYHCSICNKSFYNPTIMKKHEKGHLKVEPI